MYVDFGFVRLKLLDHLEARAVDFDEEVVAADVTEGHDEGEIGGPVQFGHHVLDYPAVGRVLGVPDGVVEVGQFASALLQDGLEVLHGSAGLAHGVVDVNRVAFLVNRRRSRDRNEVDPGHLDDAGARE